MTELGLCKSEIKYMKRHLFGFMKKKYVLTSFQKLLRGTMPQRTVEPETKEVNMSDLHLLLLAIICICCVLIFVLVSAKIIYICKTFEQFKKENNANLFNVASQVRKQDAQDQALLTEVRRTNRLLTDLYRRLQGKQPLEENEVTYVIPEEGEDIKYV